MNSKFDNLENTFGYALHHASFAFRSSLKNAFLSSGLNLTTEEFVFLGLIPEKGATQRDLAGKSLKDKTTVTRLVDRLVVKGWVSRIENPDNRREQIITKTESGAEVLHKAVKQASMLVQTSLATLSEDEIEIGSKVLNRVIVNLT